MGDWRIESLDETHERDEFRCDKSALDDFLRFRAGQYERRGLGRTYVAVRPGKKRVVGYYTLSASAVQFAHLPPKKAKKLPKHPIPVILLGRLAVDRSARGEGLGVGLLTNALSRSLELARSLGVFALEVMALDADAKAFYLKYGFSQLMDHEFHLYLPMRTIEESAGPLRPGT